VIGAKKQETHECITKCTHSLLVNLQLKGNLVL